MYRTPPPKEVEEPPKRLHPEHYDDGSGMVFLFVILTLLIILATILSN